VLQYIASLYLFGALRQLLRIATCGCIQPEKVNDDANADFNYKNFSEAVEQGFVHGQVSYHFIDNTWYKQRLALTPEEEVDFRRDMFAMDFTAKQWARRETRNSRRSRVLPGSQSVKV